MKLQTRFERAQNAASPDQRYLDALNRLISGEGQLAYEADVIKTPLYHDGSPRVSWDQLSRIAQFSWSRSRSE